MPLRFLVVQVCGEEVSTKAPESGKIRFTGIASDRSMEEYVENVALSRPQLAIQGCSWSFGYSFLQGC